jgi:hypothetical protein
MIWSLEKNELFSVRSAYRQQFINSHGVMFPSTSAASPAFWKKLWYAKVPGKVKVCLWKACQNILPTRTRLFSRHVPIITTCVLCGCSNESIEHICRDCPYTRAIIQLHPRLASLFPSLSLSVNEGFGQWLGDFSSQLSHSEFETLMMLIWAVWKERNNRVWDGVVKTPNIVAFHAFHRLQEFRNACSLDTHSSRCRLAPWKPPPVGWIKANLDGAYDEHSHTGGAGVVLHDHSGSVVGGFCTPLSHVASPELAEAMAGRLACSFAVEHQLSPLIFETDSTMLVSATRDLVPHTSLGGRVYDDIVSLLSELPSSHFLHVYREANVLAHDCARFACISRRSLSWIGAPPIEVRSCISSLCNL